MAYTYKDLAKEAVRFGASMILATFAIGLAGGAIQGLWRYAKGETVEHAFNLDGHQNFRANAAKRVGAIEPQP
jgi:alkylation response protein AidB-like acyl-CoA dehydrogenase